MTVAAVQPERLLLARHRDLVHVLAQLDLWLVVHRDQLEDASQGWLSLAGDKVGAYKPVSHIFGVLQVQTYQFQKL